MSNFIKTQDIVKEMNKKALGGAKNPHSCSLPVLRKVDGDYGICLFIQLYTKEQMSTGMMQRPSYWCLTDILDGGNFREYSCKESEFCSAPYNRFYSKGAPEKRGDKQDIINLYLQFDNIRKHYIETGILDAFSYKKYLADLFKIVPSGQINFYKELSKMI